MKDLKHKPRKGKLGVKAKAKAAPKSAGKAAAQLPGIGEGEVVMMVGERAKQIMMCGHVGQVLGRTEGVVQVDQWQCSL